MVLIARTNLLVWVVFVLTFAYTDIGRLIDDNDYHKGGPNVLFQILVGFILLAPIVAIILLIITLWV